MFFFNLMGISFHNEKLVLTRADSETCCGCLQRKQTKKEILTDDYTQQNDINRFQILINTN